MTTCSFKRLADWLYFRCRSTHEVLLRFNNVDDHCNRLTPLSLQHLETFISRQDGVSPSCFWRAPRWRSPARQHWASPSSRAGPTDGRRSGWKRSIRERRRRTRLDGVSDGWHGQQLAELRVEWLLWKMSWSPEKTLTTASDGDWIALEQRCQTQVQSGQKCKENGQSWGPTLRAKTCLSD